MEYVRKVDADLHRPQKFLLTLRSQTEAREIDTSSSISLRVTHYLSLFNCPEKNWAMHLFLYTSLNFKADCFRMKYFLKKPLKFYSIFYCWKDLHWKDFVHNLSVHNFSNLSVFLFWIQPSPFKSFWCHVQKKPSIFSLKKKCSKNYF